MSAAWVLVVTVLVMGGLIAGASFVSEELA